MTRLLQFFALVCVIVAFGHSPASADYALYMDEKTASVDRWSIGYNRATSGCIASADYSDETTIWIGFDGETQNVYMGLTNPNWQSIQVGKQYPIKIFAVGGKKWGGTFFGAAHNADRGIVSGSLKKQFVGDLIRSPGIAVLVADRTIAKLNLDGSPAAFEAVLECQSKYASAGRPPEKTGNGPAGVIGSGTGFFISAKGHLLTNNHVVAKCTQVEIEQPGEQRRSAQVLATDKTNDLALLKSSVPPPAVVALRTGVRIGENIAVYGFPLTGDLASSGNFTVGYVSALAGLRDDTAKMQISAPIQPGNSGGPVFDRDGNVVGVVVASATNAIMEASAGVVAPQNINWAIKASIAKTFLESNGINADAPVQSNTKYELPDLAERARLNTVLVWCKR